MASVLGFYSWIARGLAPYRRRDDGDMTDPYVEAQVAITEELASGTNTPPAVTVTLGLASPRHVVGVEPGIVTRVWPKAGVTDAETDYFPLIEFADADFPWRYSPVRGHDPDGGSTRQPWVALVVLRDDEIEYRPAGPTRRLASIKVLSVPASLLPAAELHLWAHTQVTGAPDGGPAVGQVLRETPERALSRLVCPRFLGSKQSYRAFLVPTYLAGAQVGLGQTVSNTRDLAWGGTSGGSPPADVELPVYYEWSFVTGDVGSFYDLARRLVPRVLETSGTRTMDVSAPGHGQLDNLTATVEVGGALRPFEADPYAWPPEDRAKWHDRIAGILEPVIDLPDGDNEAPPKPTLAPPLYGRWYAGVAKLDGEPPDRPAPPWFRDLNEAPHQRVPAALGAAAIQADQQALMASAWQQVDGLLAANQQLKQAQLAREASLQSYRRHLAVTPRPGRLIQVVGAVLGRVRMPGGRTAVDAVRASRIPDGFLDPAWRRLTRPLGPLGRRQRRPDATLPPEGRDTVEDLNDGRLDPSFPLPSQMPDGVVGPGAGARCPGCLSPALIEAIAALTSADDVYRIGAALFIEGREYADYGHLFRVEVMRIGAMLIEAAATPGGLAAWRDRILRECLGTPVSEDIDRAPPIAPPWRVDEPVPDDPGVPPGPAPPGTTPGPEEIEFRTGADALLDTLNAEPLPAPTFTPVNIAVLRTEILRTVDPQRAIADAVWRRLSRPATWNPADRLEPLLVVPEFAQPMYEPLRDISTEWIMPGIGEIPANTMTMVTPNQAFIEAYMVGLNHEMGRELLWHEYPNDLRGTYFRQFWDVRGMRDAHSDPRDIKAIAGWGPSELGTNRPVPLGERIVLFVRGDLLHRYPQVVVYMAKATAPLPVPPVPPEPQPDDEEKYALFRGKLGSDAAIHGFDLTKDVARGTQIEAGWYVVLQEPPGEPRFGMPEAGTYLPDAFLRAAEIPDDGRLSSAHAAQELYRKPVRVAFHAALMLPP